MEGKKKIQEEWREREKEKEKGDGGGQGGGESVERGRGEGDQTEGGEGETAYACIQPWFPFFSQLVMYLIQVKRNHDVSCH